jgi:hypothetical protein
MSTPLIKSTNPKDLIGIRKPPIDLVSPFALVHMAMAMKNGAVKYGPYNWRDEKVSAKIYVAAAMRHLLEWLDGEENARDSKCHHLGHAAACCAILLDAQATDQLVDDRPKTGGKVTDLIESLTEKADPPPVVPAVPSEAPGAAGTSERCMCRRCLAYVDVADTRWDEYRRSYCESCFKAYKHCC